MFTYLIYKTRKLEKFYNDLVSSEKISIGEEFGFGMFEGDNEMHIYNFTPTAIQGPAGVAAGGTLSIPKIGFNIESIPLSHYRDKNFYQMKNDSLDRFGTRLEKRFSKEEIIDMLIDAGMEKIIFSQNDPYWVCLSYKKT